ncbi:hypothetical protein TWF696_009712 [Orbilia brochopaga]|uniref:Uncharacterized protein n=1 Tax=Orbilia brochopaga TaxID=3140254 RepID=A0AAV9UC33_9PEZI
MAGNNLRPTSRSSTPRQFLDAAEGSGIRDRASMISDIESINGDDYHSLSRTNSFFSADSGSFYNRMSRQQSSPSGTIRGAPPLPLSPPSIPAIEPSNLSSPIPVSHGSQESTPHGRMYPAPNRLTVDSLVLERQSSSSSNPSTLNLGGRSYPGSERDSVGSNSPPYAGQHIERSTSPGDSSQASPAESTAPASLSSATEALPLIPAKIPTKGPPLHILTGPRSRPQSMQRPDSLQTLGSESTGIRGRQESNQTASSYAMFSPTNRGSQGSYPSEKTAVGADPPTPLRYPPHAVEAMRGNIQRPPAHFFHGPPPVHGADTSPPLYDNRELPPPTLVSSGQPRSWSEKIGLLDPTDNDPSKPWYRRRKGYCFWLILGLIGFIVVVFTTIGIVVGREIKHRKHRNNWWSAANSTGIPPPRSVMGQWTYTTNLTNATASCAPTVNGASNDLWRCLPYENPPVSNAVWSFVITKKSNTTAPTNNGTEEVEQLLISSVSNPYDTPFPSTPLNLLQYMNTTYYQFTFNYTKETNLTVNGAGVTCEFPNSIFTGTLYLNQTRFGWRRPGPNGGIYRGEWPGNVIINEEKVSGGRQVVCRNNVTMDVVPLNPVTLANGEGACLCRYQNFVGNI